MGYIWRTTGDEFGARGQASKRALRLQETGQIYRRFPNMQKTLKTPVDVAW